MLTNPLVDKLVEAPELGHGFFKVDRGGVRVEPRSRSVCLHDAVYLYCSAIDLKIVAMLEKLVDGQVFLAEPGSSSAVVCLAPDGVLISQVYVKRKKTEESLKRAEHKYRELYESSRDAIMILEPPSWNFTAGNKAALEMFGAKNERAFISRRPYELSPEGQADGQPSKDMALKMINLAMEAGSHLFDWQHKRINGEVFPATVLLTRMELDGREVLQAEDVVSKNYKGNTSL